MKLFTYTAETSAQALAEAKKELGDEFSIINQKKLSDGTYSDARVLTLRELFILSSINPDIDLPEGVSDSQIRYIVGEGIPPKRLRKIIKGASYND